MRATGELRAWTVSGIALTCGIAVDRPVRLLSIRSAGTPAALPRADADSAPSAEVQVLGQGRFPGSHRYADTTVGARLRYTGHVRTTAPDGSAELRPFPA